MDYLQSLQDQALQELNGRIPKSYFQEFSYQVKAFNKGRTSKAAFAAVLTDIIRHIQERQLLTPSTRRRKTRETVYILNEFPFTLTDEPAHEGFLNSYHDLNIEKDVFRADDPLEQKGRITKPLVLDSYLDFLIGDKRKTLGVDCAGKGDDRTVLTILHGGHCCDIQAYFRREGSEIVGLIVSAINEWSPDEVVLDSTGGYGTIASMLIDLGLESVTTITPVVFNNVPRSDHFNCADQRTEMMLYVQEKLKNGELTLPFHPLLIEELSWLRYTFRHDGKIMLESKDNFKKRNKRSSDFADSLALANYPRGEVTLY